MLFGRLVFLLTMCLVVTACSQSPTGPSAIAPRVATSTAQQAVTDEPPEITVAPPRALGLTRYMAFGDSITGGTTSSFFSIFETIGNGYPERLQAGLNAAHSPQQFTVFNEGLGGEAVTMALSRFRSTMSTHRPEAVLLLEGINDLSGDTDPVRAASYVFLLIDNATAMGVPVLVATMYQTYSVTNPLGEYRSNGAPLVPLFNAEIRRLAAGRLNVYVVDLESAIRDRSLVGNDGLHLSDAGFQAVASAFQQRIETAFSVRGSFQ